jgi:hypothetical protein
MPIVTHTGGTASLLVVRLPDSLSRERRIFVQRESTARSKPCGPVRHPHSDSEWIGSHPALQVASPRTLAFHRGTIAGSLRPVGVHSGFRPFTSPAPRRCIPPQWQLGNLHCRAFHPLDHQLSFTAGSHPPSQHTRQPSMRSPDATGLASRRNRHSDPSMALSGEGGRCHSERRPIPSSGGGSSPLTNRSV